MNGLVPLGEKADSVQYWVGGARELVSVQYKWNCCFKSHVFCFNRTECYINELILLTCDSANRTTMLRIMTLYLMPAVLCVLERNGSTIAL